MADTTTTATPPASSGGIDAKVLADAIAAGVAEQLKPLTEQLAKLATPAAASAPPAPQTAEKPLTASDLQKMLNERDQQTQSRQQLEAAKGKFTAEKLKDLPQVYQGLLGNDPTKWAAEEQDIRTRFKADFKAAGGTAASVGGDGSEGTAAGGAIDLSKMSTQDKLALGLKQSQPARSGPVAANAAAAAK